ncbi:hypothetical protein BGZ76_010586 [Entomortierella beljakovae]|nr:hypothetical protein BGZ76_010586 [Entomortierella beljakovae]
MFDPTNNRNRRHSHTGLINSEYNPSMYNRARTVLRQSLSQTSPYQLQHQPIRTPRALRSALRKARKEQSPLLTSASFGSGYTIPSLVSDLDSEDIPLSWKVAEDESTARYIHNSLRVDNTNYESNGLALSLSEKMDRSITEESDSDIETEERPPVDSTRISPMIRANYIPTSDSDGHNLDPSEVLNVDELSDNDMCVESRSIENFESHNKDGTGDSEVGHQDMELEDTLDADMAMILGMTSDMELMIPKFDDEYLEDLKSDIVHDDQGRQSSIASEASPSCSDYLSTTIACRSTQDSPKSRSGTPRVTSCELRCRAESLPVSPGVLAARSRMQTCNGTQSKSLSPRSSCVLMDSPLQESAILHQDIDNLKRHRDSLKQSADPVVNIHPLSSCSSPSTTTTCDEHKRPIYFKPSHHSITNHGNSSDQSPHHIQSSHWTSDNPGFPAQVSNATQCEDRIFRTQGPSQRSQLQLIQSPPPSQPSIPRLSQNKNIMMTANNISMVTANMSVLTPQEAQDDYYARRNQRMLLLRQRRKSAMIDRGPPSRGPEGHMPWTRRNSMSNFHPLDKPVVPAIGAHPLPASYFIPPSAFRTEAAAAVEREAERRRSEQEEESYLVFPSPTLS